MNRKVSPVFAVIVVLVALAIGALWFLFSYRTHEAREAAYNETLRQQIDSTKREGMPGMRRSDMRSRGSRAGRSRSPSPAPGGGENRGPAPGAGSAGE